MNVVWIRAKMQNPLSSLAMDWMANSYPTGIVDGLGQAGIEAPRDIGLGFEENTLARRTDQSDTRAFDGSIWERRGPCLGERRGHDLSP